GAGPETIWEDGVPHGWLSHAARVAAAAAVAYLPVLAASALGAAAWAMVVGAALLLLAVRRVFDAEALACALIPAAALTLSGFVQPASQYLAVATIGFAFVGRCLIDRREGSIGLLT